MRTRSGILLAVTVTLFVSLLTACSNGLFSGPAPALIHDREKSADLTADEIWSGNIHVTSTVRVPEGTTLTVMPGTVVKFRHYRGYRERDVRAGLIVEGDLIAVGTPEHRIRFTSDADDPMNGDWWGIHLRGTDGSEFSYTIVEYGELGIILNESSAPIRNSIIRWNNAEGLYAERSKPIIEYNRLYGNGYHEIALEQYNDVVIRSNIIGGGHFGVHLEKTSALIEGNLFQDEEFHAITAGMESDLAVTGNRFENIGRPVPVSIDHTCTSTLTGNDFGGGSVPAPEIGYEDIRDTELGYVPGDPEDRYLYIYDAEDETRRIVRKIGAGLSFGWALAHAEGYLWRFSLGHGELGSQLDFIRIDPETGSFLKIRNDFIMNPRGLTHDGRYFWVNDFSLLKIYRFEVQGNAIAVLDSFDIPEKEKGGTAGLTTDGEHLFLRSRDGEYIYKLDTHGNLLGEIPIPGGTLVWTGEHFWTTDGNRKGISRFDRNGTILGSIYPPAKDTWALAWDGTCLWTIQRTCEMWDDPKIYQLEILDDSLDE